jgi:hypothetical protein
MMYPKVEKTLVCGSKLELPEPEDVHDDRLGDIVCIVARHYLVYS